MYAASGGELDPKRLNTDYLFPRVENGFLGKTRFLWVTQRI
ncbi:hypothetical protein BH695_0804 [Microcystis aeruginosa PCC 7806SL]|uniref:Uncharacterized protein n=1 Tax=Microcystis aeruginosa PCC 7806SL TaxID=1903187 RepID=A0AB33BFQ3_MICA7|nr:hypothetical protein BH695_0804 [Microcystis aeruginosa PCC 7806SL]